MIKLIASDIDGTIIGKDNLINTKNIKAIEQLQSNSNVTFAVCTGKSYAVFKNTCSSLKASYGIFGNGNQIINLKNNEEIYKVLLDNTQVNLCLDIAKQYNLHTHIYTESSLITERLEYMDLRNSMLSQNKIFRKHRYKNCP